MIISNLEQLSNWQQPGNVGNSGGGSTQPHGTFLMTPAVPGQFSAKPASPYDNGYNYIDLTPDFSPGFTPSYFAYKLQFMFPTAADLAACQANEFELQQNFNNHVFNMAWSPFGGLWHSFDYNVSKWIPTTIPAVLTPGQWVKVRADFLRGADNTLTHLTLRVNGKTNAVNIKRPATPKVEPGYIHAAFQLDTESPALPYRVEVRGMSVEML